MLAVTINVNDSPFTAFGQDAALALDGMLESHDAEFRNLECIVHYPQIRCLLGSDSL
jgi:hypothetical protein